MTYKYIKNHIEKTSHNQKYKLGDAMKPTEITYHQTYNKAPAINERNYLNNRNDKEYVGFHLVVDDKEAIECIPLNVNTWHSGDGANGIGNTESIGVEIAYSTHSDVNLRNKAIENGALLIANLMKHYAIPMSKVKSHYDRSKKNCPHDIRGRYGEDKFRRLIQSNFNELTQAKPQPSTFKVGDEVKVTGSKYATGQSIPSWVKSEVYEVTGINGNQARLSRINSWVCFKDLDKVSMTNPPKPEQSKTYKVKIKCDSLNVREKADFNSKVVTTVNKNEVYTIVGESNGLGKLKSGKGYISLNSKYVSKL